MRRAAARWRVAGAATVAGMVIAAMALTTTLLSTAMVAGCAHGEAVPQAPEAPPVVPDLAAPRDLAPPPDLVPPPDLTPPRDLAPPADLTPPRVWTARLRVSGVEINRGVYHSQDASAVMTAGLSSFWKKPRACPDLSWSFFVDDKVVADGGTKRCQYAASWPKSAAVRMVENGKPIRLVVFDRDHDTLGMFAWKTVEELAAAIAAKKKLRNDHVIELRLDGSELREEK